MTTYDRWLLKGSGGPEDDQDRDECPACGDDIPDTGLCSCGWYPGINPHEMRPMKEYE